MGVVKGVILDVDGTLVDSNNAHARAWVQALFESGFAVEFAAVRKLIGLAGERLLPLAAGISADSAQGQTITKRRQEIFKANCLPTLKPFPRTRELLLHMRDDGLKLVVASSAKPNELDPLLAICGATDLIQDQVSSDGAPSKPAPDMILAALKTMGLSAPEAVMLGDTPYDLEAASRAKVDMIALRRGGWTDFPYAAAIYDDPADFLIHYSRSPIGNDG